MKNIVALFSFLVLIGAMIGYYFIPKISIPNNIDQLEVALAKVKIAVPPSETIYFFSNNPANETEIRFKTQFVLVPRVVASAKMEEIPPNSYIVFVDDKLAESPKAITSELTSATKLLFADNHDFIVSLLKKKP